MTQEAPSSHLHFRSVKLNAKKERGQQLTRNPRKKSLHKGEGTENSQKLIGNKK